MNSPAITIGLPVYNGEQFLADAITSLLHQRFRSFELVVYDNASTDTTHEIALRFARSDARVRVVRHPNTMSAVENFIVAAQNATTPLFCWAAHDDLRDPQFLSVLTNLLESHPDAGLAASGCIEIDPDGTPRCCCSATQSLASVQSSDACRRIVAYLRHSPCSAIYGLFRTEWLQRHLNVLRTGPRFGADLVFLASFIARHTIAFTPQPLLILRGGGSSHRADQFHGALDLLRELWRFHCSLKAAIEPPPGWRDRLRITIARHRLFLRYLTWKPVRAMFRHYLFRAMPWLARPMHFMRSRRGIYSRLRRRLRRMPVRPRVVLFGAGKHTQREFGALQRAINAHGQLVAVCDDNVAQLQAICKDMPLMHPSSLERLRPDLIIVSSDTYEAALFRRASALSSGGARVWCLYDLSLETPSTACDGISSGHANNIRACVQSAAA